MPNLRSIVVLVVALLVASGPVRAQEATPVSGFDPTAIFPVHMHAGTCDDVGEIAFALGEGGYGLPVPTDASLPSEVEATAEKVGPEAANPAIVAVAEIEVSLDELTADEHVIDAHVAGADDDTARMVCGIVGGFRAGDDLVFGLQEVDGSGYAGTAWLHATGDGATRATIFLASPRGTNGGVGDGAATQATTMEPARETELAGDLPETTQVEGIVVKDGAFSVDELELLEGIPTVLHIVNTDDQDYRFQIRELVEAAPLPANDVIVVEFTVPTGGVYAVQLLAADSDDELAVEPLTVVPR